jgi:glycosyltransferase involved in cell wall biosynthesis
MTQPDIWSDFRGPQLDHAAALRAGSLEVIRLSGLFLPTTYLAHQTDVRPGADPLAHYHDHGWRTGAKPNPYFDPAWYRATNPDVEQADTDPLLHYIGYGESEGRWPIGWFNPVWYRANHAVPPGQHALAHYLCHRTTGASPIPEFDSAWYLATYPDVAAAGMDPMEHYLVQGFREGRHPSRTFDSRFYRIRYLRGRPAENPLLHYLAHRGEPGLHPSMPADETTIPLEVKRFTAPGPFHEPVRPLSPTVTPRALVLAFYLPQFHPIPENDRWWGPGFTEWSNTARALPRFAGHYQPRIPADLGPYSLTHPETLPRQIALARGAGIGGFVFYFYWFNRQRLLEAPLERLLADRALDMRFCLMWANENWTRRWDGSNDDILIAQHYAQADEPALIATFARHFADPRYIRLGGRPVLMIYRADLIPTAAQTLARWRRRFRETHAEDPLLIMAQSFGAEDPREFGFDAAVEFPPHKLVATHPLINHQLDLLDHNFEAHVYDYATLAAAAAAQPTPAYPLIRTALPGWDNDARRQGTGMVLHNATPTAYQTWLDHLITQAAAAPALGAPLVCINAWNEWAEAAYLEPDRHHGAAFLNATARAVAGLSDATRLLLIGHDAFPAGAQLLLLHIARHLIAAHGLQPEIILLGDGALEPAYRETAPTQILRDLADLPGILVGLRAAGIRGALVNSAASTPTCPALHAAGIATTLLIHEMPVLLTERALLAPLDAALATATTAIFAAEPVRAALAARLPLDLTRTAILPQGLYQPLVADPEAAAAARTAWGIPPDSVLAIALGYADHRKGFDLFLQLHAHLRADPHIHLAWIGDIDPETHCAHAEAIAHAKATGRLHLPGWRSDIAALLTAADLFLSLAREDPYPSAALEALSLGTPVLAFANSGGLPDLLRAGTGQVVPMEDTAAMARVLRVARPLKTRANLLPTPHDFPAYVASLLTHLHPAPLPSVIVPCYRQAPFLPRRLGSIFAQTAPIRGLTLCDDASDDGSAEAAAAIARANNRALIIVRSPTNTGSPFGAWRDAVTSAESDLIWIAEADDSSAPDFLARLLPAFEDPEILFAFADSQPIAPDGTPRPETYRASYEAAAGPGALAASATYLALAFARQFLSERNILFNVSAIVWRRAPLLQALNRLGDDLLTWRIAGDWRLTVELLTTYPGRVSHIAVPLNLHHRGPATVTARLSPAQHIDEIRRMHTLIRRRLGPVPGLAARQRAYLTEATKHLQQTKC